MNLHILRPCRQNPTVLAHTTIEEKFELNKTPLAPPGIKLLVHKKTQHSKTWGIYGVLGWYIGKTMEHYR